MIYTIPKFIMPFKSYENVVSTVCRDGVEGMLNDPNLNGVFD